MTSYEREERTEVADLVKDCILASAGEKAQRVFQEALIFAYRRGRLAGWRDCFENKAQGELDLGLE